MQVPFEKEAMTEESTVKSGSSLQALEPIDPYMETKVLRKCDLHVLPILSILFMAAFLDRINIGNVSNMPLAL